MKTTTRPSRSVIQLTEQQGAFIVCEEGQLWLTDNGDDIVLTHGERHQIQGQQAVVIESLRLNSRFRLDGVQEQSTGWLGKLHSALHHLHTTRQPHAHA